MTISVATGRRGFISVPALIKQTGDKRAALIVAATAAGLVQDTHGRYGLCFSRPR